MRTLICGSRDFLDGQAAFRFLDSLRTQPTLVISGAARGADTIARAWAIHRKIPLQEYPADWKLHGKGAGFRRNLEMLDACEVVVAFWDGSSPGTQHTLREAQARKLPIYLCVPADGDLFVTYSGGTV